MWNFSNIFFLASVLEAFKLSWGRCPLSQAWIRLCKQDVAYKFLSLQLCFFPVVYILYISDRWNIKKSFNLGLRSLLTTSSKEVFLTFPRSYCFPQFLTYLWILQCGYFTKITWKMMIFVCFFCWVFVILCLQFGYEIIGFKIELFFFLGGTCCYYTSGRANLMIFFVSFPSFHFLYWSTRRGLIGIVSLCLIKIMSTFHMLI